MEKEIIQIIQEGDDKIFIARLEFRMKRINHLQLRERVLEALEEEKTKVLELTSENPGNMHIDGSAD
jgi:histidyl-tRNA synthetase